MTPNFNLRRWWTLVSLHWTENRRRYQLAMLVVTGLLLLWCCLYISVEDTRPMNADMQFGTYYIGLFCTGCIFACTVFAGLNRKTEATQFLMVPASHLEKLLCGLFFGTLLFFIVYTALFYLVDLSMVELSREIAVHRLKHAFLFPRPQPGALPSQPVIIPSSQLIAQIQWPSLVNIFSNTGGPMPDSAPPPLLMIFFAIQSTLLLGSVYFRRYAILKTVLASLLIALLAMLFMVKGIAGHLPGGWGLDTFLSWRRNLSAYDIQWVRLPFWAENFLLLVFKFILPAFFALVLYYRLKEKEV